MPNIAECSGIIVDRIARAAARSGRSPGCVSLVAVSKNHPPESVMEAVEAGLDVFGESRVQEARAKIPALPGRLRWHFIGHLQRNKMRAALPLFELFHGIDSVEAATDLNRVAGEEGFRPAILLEVNVSGEGTKFGVKPRELAAALEKVTTLDRLEVRGLMTMAPYAEDAEKARPYFSRLRALRDSMQLELGIGLPELSMGMSGDFEVAVEEGSTLVRVGTAIFGDRVRRNE